MVTTADVNPNPSRTKKLVVPPTQRAAIVVAIKGVGDKPTTYKGAAELIGRGGEADVSARIVCKHDHATNAEATPCAESLTRENQTH